MKKRIFYVPCRVPWPACHPGGCRVCAGLGFTSREMPDTLWNRLCAWWGCLLVLLVCACVDPTPGDLRLDPAPELEGETRAAAERVLAATGVDVFGGAYEVTLRLAPASAVVPPPGAAPCPTCTWAGHFDGREILVNAEVAVDDRERTVLHEVLHALILQPGAHLPRGVEGVLSEQRTVDCLTAADLERVCARVACKRFVIEEGCK